MIIRDRVLTISIHPKTNKIWLSKYPMSTVLDYAIFGVRYYVVYKT